MTPNSKELSINSDLKEPRSSASSASSSTYTTDIPDQSSPESATVRSPTARNFFSAIKQGLLRSRSPSPAARSSTSRATTPTPANLPTPRPRTPSSPQCSPTTAASENMYSKTQRTVSMYTTSSISSSVTATSSDSYQARSPKRSSTGQSDFDRMAYGRHSTEWLFGNTSITGAIKKAVCKKRDST